ncbi:MAG: pseudaminic acid synthase [Bacilli bacterium]
MESAFSIGERKIGKGFGTYIVAEMSANHNQDFKQAVKIIEAAKKAGADAIKIQTYTAETITINCDNDYFCINGTIWEGKSLYQLYKEAHTPWEWQPKLKKIANDLELDFFSTPFDLTAVDFLEEMNVAIYKIASFELIDIPLLRKVAQTGKPIIMSTGMATLSEIEEALSVIRGEGNQKIVLLKCTSAYPAPPEESNLNTIPHLSETFGVPAGLSDHTLGSAVAIAAVTLGACIVEKHFTLSRNDKGPDSAFSMEPDEFRQMVGDIRAVEKALGKVCYELTPKQKENSLYRRSLFVVQDVKAGEKFTEQNIRSIRPGNGLHTRYLKNILGRNAKNDIFKGTPLCWNLII